MSQRCCPAVVAAFSGGPTYERLRETIAKRMRMSHVVQPLMLMELLGRGRPGNSQSSPRAGRCPADPGRRRDPDR
jgi:hypothetical protein